MNIKGIAIAAVLVTSLGLAGCATQVSDTSSTHASAAAKPTVAPAPSNVHAFGSVITFKDGVSISISTAAPFTPSPEAAGVVAGQTSELFTVVLTNGSKTQLQPYVNVTATSAGAQAGSIADIGSPIGDVSSGPQTVILPGQTIKWLEGFSVADPTNLTMEADLGFDYTPAIFTTK